VREIKDMFDISHFRPEFSTQRMKDAKPLNEMVMLDGFIVPIKTLPDNLPHIVREARAKGDDRVYQTQTA
jgi:hypothetical protein